MYLFTRFLDVKRIFKMKYEDIRHVSHAVVQKAPFGWKLKSQKLSQWINCFSSGLEEVRMMISSKNGANREREVCFRSVVDSGPDGMFNFGVSINFYFFRKS